MKTVILKRDASDDIYNDDSVMQKILDGETVQWKLWYNGDGRRRQIKTEKGDRFFILQEGEGIIASGTVGGIDFIEGKSKLVKCVMNLLELIPDKLGNPTIKTDELEEILSKYTKSQNQYELVLENKSDAILLEKLWIKSVFENNSSKEKMSEEAWAVENLNVQTIEVLKDYILSTKSICACCGATVSPKDKLFYRPSISKVEKIKASTLSDLIKQYSILCKDCASIEKEINTL